MDALASVALTLVSVVVSDVMFRASSISAAARVYAVTDFQTSAA